MNKFPALIIIIAIVSDQRGTTEKYISLFLSSTVVGLAEPHSSWLVMLYDEISIIFHPTLKMRERRVCLWCRSVSHYFMMMKITLRVEVEFIWKKLRVRFNSTLTIINPESFELENILSSASNFSELMNFSTFFFLSFFPNPAHSHCSFHPECVISTFSQTFLSFFINFTFFGRQKKMRRRRGSSSHK